MEALLHAVFAMTFGLASLIPGSSAPNWVRILPEQAYSVDQSNIRRDGDIVTFSGRYETVPDFARIWLESSAPGRKPVFLVDVSQINCARRTMRFIQDTAYGEDGQPIARMRFSQTWKPIMPDSIADAEWDFVCFRGPWPLSLGE